MSSGLQAERTELAWLRTTLSCWAVGLIALKIVFPVGAPVLLGPMIVTVVAHRRRRRLRARGVPSPLSRTEGMLVAAACVAIAVIGASALL